jgi:hypothetical protein
MFLISHKKRKKKNKKTNKWKREKNKNLKMNKNKLKQKEIKNRTYNSVLLNMNLQSLCIGDAKLWLRYL